MNRPTSLATVTTEGADPSVVTETPYGTLIEYVVDGRNRRIGKKVNGVLTKAWLYVVEGLRKIKISK